MGSNPTLSAIAGKPTDIEPSGQPRSLFLEILGGVLAETQGFEPWVPLTGYDDLANRCLKPLGHVSSRQRR